MAKSDEILSAIKLLNAKLYGENGFEGDITEIKEGVRTNRSRIHRIEIIITGLVGSGVLGTGIWSLLQ